MKSLVRRGSLLLLGTTLFALVGCAGSTKHTSQGQTSNIITSSIDTSYRSPQSYSLAALEREPYTCGKNNEPCAIKLLTKMTSKYGPGAALAYLTMLQNRGRINPAFDLHQVAHLVGEETAKQFGANRRAFSLCPQIFNYGCVHGFFIYVLGRIGTPSRAAAIVCKSESTGGPLVPAFNCYHGVGHGVMMARGYDLQASLQACNTLGSHMAADGCWQGVFMENVNAEMRNQARPGVFSRAHPLEPCSSVEPRYRHECYVNQAGWLVYVAGDNLRKATRYCLKAQGYVSACAQSLGLMVTNPSWQATLAPKLAKRPFEEVAWTMCTWFPSDLREDCVIAGNDNLANFDQLNVTHARRFCGYAARNLQTVCYREIGVNLGRRTADQSIIKNRCGTLPSAGRRACLAGAVQGALPSR
jgi:hypothetical protein